MHASFGLAFFVSVSPPKVLPAWTAARLPKVRLMDPIR